MSFITKREGAGNQPAKGIVDGPRRVSSAMQMQGRLLRITFLLRCAQAAFVEPVASNGAGLTQGRCMTRLPCATLRTQGRLCNFAGHSIAGSRSRKRLQTLDSISMSSSLYQDQAAAMARRAEMEREWLEPSLVELAATAVPAKAQKKMAAVSGTAGAGFGAGAAVKKAKSAADVAAPILAKALKSEGVIRVDGALSTATAHWLQDFVLQQRAVSKQLVQDGTAGAEECFGVELERGGGLRCDLLLPLPPLAPVLSELLGANGKLGPLLAKVCGSDAELYELCSLITEPGSPRQNVHPDTPFQKYCPLYVVFVALQDVVSSMGPTIFIPGSHTQAQSDLFAARGEVIVESLAVRTRIESKGRRQRIYEEPLSELSDHRGLCVHLLVCSHLC